LGSLRLLAVAERSRSLVGWPVLRPVGAICQEPTPLHCSRAALLADHRVVASAWPLTSVVHEHRRLDQRTASSG